MRQLLSFKAPDVTVCPERVVLRQEFGSRVGSARRSRQVGTAARALACPRLVQDLQGRDGLLRCWVATFLYRLTNASLILNLDLTWAGHPCSISSSVSSNLF